MVRPTTRRLLATIVALAVACSFVGAPLGAVAATSGDGLSGTLGDDSDSDSGTLTGGEETDDGDGSDGETDDGDGSDGETDDGDGSDGETDDAPDGEETEDEGEDENGTADKAYRSDAADSSGDDEESDDNATSDMAEPTSAAVESTAAAVESTADSLESSIDSDLESYETVDGRLLLTGESLLSTDEVSLQDLHVSAAISGADSAKSGGTEGTTRTAAGSAAVDQLAEAGGGDDAMVYGGAGGDPPAPSAPAGGAVIGLGAVAAAAAIRSSPVAASAANSSGLGSWVSSAVSSALDRVPPFLLPLRYSRYDDSDPLEHEARELVYDIVNDRPGSYLSEVADEADLPLSTTRHHIKVLEREDLVSGAKVRGKRRFYPAYTEDMALDAALSDRSTASIIDAIARRGAASVSDLADDLGRDPSTISHHLQRLEEDDIISRERRGRSVMNKLATEVRSALDPEATPKPEEDPREIVVTGAD